MALATRCPHCQTTFRVANDQLKLHAGLVRCGACQQTFNGVEHLIAPDTAEQSAVVRPTVSSATPEIRQNPPAATEASRAAASIPATPPVQTQDNDKDKPALQVWKTASATMHEESAETFQGHAGSAANSAPDTHDLSASLDFVLGDEDPAGTLSSLQEQPVEIIAAQVELETKAALLDEPSIDWSVADLATEDLSAGDSETIAAAGPVLHAVTTTPYAAEDNANTDELTDLHGDDLLQSGAQTLPGEDDDSHAEADDDKPDFVLQAEKEQRHGKWLRMTYLLMILILLPLLLAQAAYFFRIQLSAVFPVTRPVLTHVCQLLRCQIGLPAQIDAISIESNELQALAPDKNVFSLVMQLQNHAATAQAWPVVELVLNDSKDKAVLQKAFQPADYLPASSDLSKGFSPGTEQNIKLFFELPKLKAAGYHVSVFYP
ncbi:DUF3426 domain-containing protein [Undibacterium oligocarboniphilum]|uniref:DUF3426 domain-containing protein n=1 Tax=Undibacterium oligocarboniphilum TaxID=666702 RepID=A0A850QHQ6_9BURK|nr:DUF3426 domain-containing protein [Undibacterium oligocarboniphilum]NVO78567.1 DUF3426 domain-containing protein [Undibacterium oligocarboniphilum]